MLAPRPLVRILAGLRCRHGDRTKVAPALSVGLAVAFVACHLSVAAAAAKHYGPGVSDTEIKIGQTMPYSGPLSAYGSAIGNAEQAYFRALNRHGGIKGRKVTLLSLDDGYEPAKALEQVRRLVEADGVLAIMGTIGTAPNLAMRKYLNARKVPQFFVLSGASAFDQPERFPWTVPFNMTYRSESRIYAKFILATKSAPKIAVLYQDDDLGREYLAGLRAGLGARARTLIVATASYGPSDPSVDSQIITLQSSGANTLVEFAIGKFVAQAIRKSYDLGWHPLQIVSITGASIKAALKPAGLDKSIGIVTASSFRDPSEPGLAADPEARKWLEFMKRDYPEGDPTNGFTLAGYSLAMLTTEVLRRCGDDLTRDNLLRVVTHLDRVRVPLLIPGASITITPTDYESIRHVQFRRFDGKTWQPIVPAPVAQ
jgi:branched-chain amino acid transport system substrate-binding protein